MRGISLFLLGTCCLINLTTEAKVSTEAAQVKNVSMSGYIGTRVDDCFRVRVLGQNADELVEPFKLQDETQQRWASEFWGKWVQGAMAYYQYNHNPEIYAKIQDSAEKMMACQLPDGYIGDYDSEHQLKGWDVWGRKYTLLGLLKWYKLSGDKKALKSACRLLDYTLTQIGPGKKHIYETGNYRGMPPSSILEPVMFMYDLTKDQRYLDFAKYIVEDDETPAGPRLIAKCNERVAERFPLQPGQGWWGFENGQKAYEMMSCYVGLLELYRVTGTEQYRNAAETTWKHIVEEEINITGSAASLECFYGGAKVQTHPAAHTMETCVTFTWMQFNERLLEFSGDSKYVDQMERTMYNALMASMKDDASQIVKYTPLEGFRREGEDQCDVHINCCNANAPRAFAMIPRVLYRAHAQNQVDVNLYIPSTATIQLGKRTVALEQKTEYPRTGEVELSVTPDKNQPLDMALALRIPGWSPKVEVSVNGEPCSDVKPGAYYTITRSWKAGDRITLKMDMPAHIVELNGCMAVERGPIVFARDSRYKDGDVDEVVVIPNKNGTVELKPADGPKGVWMSYTVPMVRSTYSDASVDTHPVHLCDFASAGSTWDESTRYRVWLTKLLHPQSDKATITGYW